MIRLNFPKFNKTIIVIILVAFLVGSTIGGVVWFYGRKLITEKFVPTVKGDFSYLSNLFKSLKPKFILQLPFRPIESPSAPPKELPEQTRLKIKDEFQEESATIAAVRKVSPSVVSIIITKEITQNERGFIFPDDFFDFGWPFQFQWPFETPQPSPKSTPKTEKQQIGGGTGFVISSKDGLILTNRHVIIDEQAEYTVITNEGQKYPARVLARDSFNDLAVLKVETSNLPEVELGDSDNLQIGQTVIAIGFALGEFRNTVTKGVISGIGRTVVAGDSFGQSEVLENVIQTDAAINRGNSGGPLINLAGQVVGVNTAIAQGGQLIGFAIPINQVKQVIQGVKTSGRIIRPFLGVRYVLINEAIARANNLPVNYGALILRGRSIEELAVTPGSPADKAGLVENDIILEINGQKIDEDHTLAKEIQKYQPGQTVQLKVLHRGEEKMVNVNLAEFK